MVINSKSLLIAFILSVIYASFSIIKNSMGNPESTTLGILFAFSLIYTSVIYGPINALVNVNSNPNKNRRMAKNLIVVLISIGGICIGYYIGMIYFGFDLFAAMAAAITGAVIGGNLGAWIGLQIVKRIYKP